MEKEYNKYLWSPKQPRVYGISPLTISGTPMPEEDVATLLKVENSQQRFQQNPIVKRAEQWEAQQKQREEEIAASKKWLELHPEDDNDDPYTIFERGKHQAIVEGKDPSYYEKMINDGKQFTKGALGVLSLPYLGAATAGAYGYGASLGARGLFAGQGIYGLANKDGVRKTYNLTKDAIKGTGSWGDAAKSAGGDALNLAMIIPGTKFLTNVARAGYKPAIAADAINLATRTIKLPATEPLLNVGWAPKQTIGVTRAGEYDKMFYPNRYDVVHGNANPFGVWLQGKVGTSKPGLKAQIARDVMANRPAQYRGTVTLGKPIASVGEVSDRDALSRIIEGTGADGIIYNNVYDNGFNNNQVIHSFVKPELVDINKPAVVKYYGPTMGKSFAAKSNPNLIDLDTWGMPEYNQLAKKYGYKDWREMILSDKGDYNQEYKTLIKDQIRRIQADPQYNGKTIVVSNASLLKPDSGITFANTPLIPERGILAFRNHQRHPWESIEHGKQWWDSLQQKGTPLTIDNRFISDIELTPGNTTLFNTSFSPKGKTSYAFFERPSKLSKAEWLDVPKDLSPNISRSLGFSSTTGEELFMPNEILGEFVSGKNQAAKFFQQPVVQNSYAHNKELANRLGINIADRPENISEIVGAPIKLNPYIQNPGNELANIAQSYLGDPSATLSIAWTPFSKRVAKLTGIHEGLHRGHYAQVIKPTPPITKNYYETTMRPEATFWNWKINKLLKPEYQNGYLGGPFDGEAGVNLIEMGRDMGVKLGTKYPGDEVFMNMINNYNGHKSFLIPHLNLDTRAGRRHIWDAMTGQYFKQGGILKRK